MAPAGAQPQTIRTKELCYRCCPSPPGIVTELTTQWSIDHRTAVHELFPGTAGYPQGLWIVEGISVD